MKVVRPSIINQNYKKFDYLNQSLESSKIVNIDQLNARLNRSKKLNIYSNIKITVFYLFCLTVIAIIGLKF